MSERWGELVGDLDDREHDELMDGVRGCDMQVAHRHFPFWAHPGQTEPDGDWSSWVLMAGRGFGKTRAGAEWVAGLVRAGGQRPSFTLGTNEPAQLRRFVGPNLEERDSFVPNVDEGRGPEAGQDAGPLRIALVAATLDEARRIMVEGASGLLAVAPDLLEEWAPHRRALRLGGAELTLFSGASPDALRGPEHHLAWCDELAKWEKPGETWDMLRLGLRLGPHPRALVTTTPRPGPVLRRIMGEPGTVVTGGRTRANPHLPSRFVDTVESLYVGTRLARQELEGELLSDVAGALWTIELLERCRLSLSPSGAGQQDRPPDGPEGRPAGLGWGLSPNPVPHGHSPPPAPPLKGRGAFTRTLIGVDPPSGDGTCGIVACARDADGVGHVLADHSVAARSPEGWARAVAAAVEAHGASLVVAECNQGGRMVASVLRAAGVAVPVRAVHAAVSKSARADPVATLFEAGRIRLHGRFPELEAELCGLVSGGAYEGPGPSPDRADAMVWALTELMLKDRAEPRVLQL